MNKERIELTEEERQWMPPQSIDMIHPSEEVGKNLLVVLTAAFTFNHTFLPATSSSTCNRGEWLAFLLPFLLLYVFAFLGCLGHDLIRLRKRERGSTRRNLAIVRLVVGGATIVVVAYACTRPSGGSSVEGDDDCLPSFPETPASGEPAG